MMIGFRITKGRSLFYRVMQSQSGQISEARSVREEMPIVEPFEEEKGAYLEAGKKIDKAMGFYKTGPGLRDGNVTKSFSYARAFNSSDHQSSAAANAYARYYKAQLMELPHRLTSTRTFTKKTSHPVKKFHNPSTVARKAAILKEEWERKGAEATEVNKDTFPIAGIRRLLKDLLARQQCDGDMARKIHALTITSGILNVPGDSSLEIRNGLTKLYRLWCEGKPIDATYFEKHLKSTDPTKY